MTAVESDVRIAVESAVLHDDLGLPADPLRPAA
jgi:hypothetical protein